MCGRNLLDLKVEMILVSLESFRHSPYYIFGNNRLEIRLSVLSISTINPKGTFNTDNIKNMFKFRIHIPKSSGTYGPFLLATAEGI